MGLPATVYVVDDDESIRTMIGWLLKSLFHNVKTCGCAEEFWQVFDAKKPGCIILDVRLPGTSGLEIQTQLNQKGASTPIIMISGYAGIPTVVQAMKAGAFDFLEKPFNDQTLLDRVQAAIRKDQQNLIRQTRIKEFDELVASLTPREQEILSLVVKGKSSKVIAEELGVSCKTVEAHRANFMRKTKVDSIAELAFKALRIYDTNKVFTNGNR